MWNSNLKIYLLILFEIFVVKLINLIKNRCPICNEGKVFKNNNLASFAHSKMNADCPVCKLSFSKDPGFYWGSMYVSYGLAMIEAVLGYFICRTLGTEKYDYINLAAAVAAIIIFSPLNYRLARLSWLYLVPKN